MKTALITGANRGLGLELAKIFYKNGWRLILHCRHEMPDIFEGAVVVHGDLTNPKTLVRLHECVFNFGTLDLLINNAGVYQNHKITIAGFAELENVLQVNLHVPLRLIRLFWPFLKNTAGAVVNVNSLAGKAGADGELAYSASKHGLAGISQALQFDGSRDNIRILDICLGSMNTKMTEGRVLDKEKLINPVEVADLIFYLCVKKYNSLRIPELLVMRSRY